MINNKINNVVELSLIHIKTRIPSIVNNFLESFLKFGLKPLEEFLNMILTDRESYIKFRHSEKISSKKMNGNTLGRKGNFTFLNRVSPLELIEMVDIKSFHNIFKDYYIKDNYIKEDLYKDIANSYKSSLKYNDFSIDNSYQAPILEEVNIGLMDGGLLIHDSCGISKLPPRIGVKCIENFKLEEILNNDVKMKKDNSNLLMASFGIAFTSSDRELPPINPTNSLDNSKISEFVIMQIDYLSLLQSLMEIYQEIYFNAKQNDQVRELLKTLSMNDIDIQQVVDLEFFNTLFEKENSNDHSGFYLNSLNIHSLIVLNKLFETNINEDDTEIGDFIDKLKSELDYKLTEFIKNTTMSAITTYLAKVGKDEIYDKYKLNHDLLQSLIEGNTEDFNYTNTLFMNSGGTNEYKSESSFFRKRFFDYTMIMDIVSRDSKKSLTSSGYIPSNHYISTSINESYNVAEDKFRHTRLYKFIYYTIQELYSHMTYTANFDKNIVGYNSNGYIYSDTYDLAKIAYNKYITSDDVLLDLNVFFGEYLNSQDKIKNIFIPSNTYAFNTLKNHRAFGAIFKASIHAVVKLMYHLSGMKEEARMQKIDKTEISEEFFVKYRKILKEIENISNLLNNSNQYDNNLRDYFLGWGRLTSVTSNLYSRNLFLNNKNQNVTIEYDEFVKDDALYNDYLEDASYFKIFYEIYIHSKCLKRDHNENEVSILTTDIFHIVNTYCHHSHSGNELISKLAYEFYIPYYIYDYILALYNDKDPHLLATNDEIIAAKESLDQMIKMKFSKIGLYNDDIRNINSYVSKSLQNDNSIENLIACSALYSGYELCRSLENDSQEKIHLDEKGIRSFEKYFDKRIKEILLK